MSDPSEILIRVESWPFTMLDNRILLAHKDFSENGILTDGDMTTYIFLSLWGQRNGEVWANRDGLAGKHGIGRSTLLERVGRLEKAGWLVKRRETRGGVKRVVLRLRVLGDHDAEPTATPAENSRGVESPEIWTGESRNLDPAVQKSGPISSTRKEKKEKEEPAEPSSAHGFAESSRAAVPGEEAEEDPSEKKKATRSRSAAPPPPAQARKVIEAPKDTGIEPPSRNGKKRGRKKPLKRNPAVDRLWTVWATEVKARWPSYAVPTPSGKAIGQTRNLYKRFGEEAAAKIIRVAIWDWLAIQESVETWKTKDTPIPDMGDILFLGTKLASFVVSGVTSPARRVSTYHQRYVSPPSDKTEASKKDGLSLAAQLRQKYWGAG